MTPTIPDHLTVRLTNAPTTTVSAVINLSSIRFSVGDILSCLTAEYLVQELRALFYTMPDDITDVMVHEPTQWLRDNRDHSRWLFENADYGDNVSDPFSLDEMYQSDGESLSIVIGEAHCQPDYLELKQYLITHKDRINQVSFDYGDAYVICQIEHTKEVS